MMSRSLLLLTCLLISLLTLVACGSDTTLPTIQPTVNSGNDDIATVDPNLGSGFDPNLGGDNNTDTTQATPTRESGSSVGGDTESGARGTGFTAQITGGSIANITDGGQYACNLTGHRIASGNTPAPNITFTLPTTNAIGSHTLSRGAIDIQVFLASVDDSYNQVTGGTLTIDDIAEASGEFVSGSFDFTVRNATGAEVGVRGDFTFESGDTAYC
jgi:hypothetical protein